MFKNIIFDIGGVLITGTFAGYPVLLSKILDISRDIALSEWTDKKNELLTGRLKSDEFLRYLSTKYSISKSLDLLSEEWVDGYIVHRKEDLNLPLLELIAELNTRYSLYAFSDCLDIDYNDQIVRRYVYPLFKGVVLSIEENLEKSNPNAYSNLISNLNLMPSETIFIDDKEANVALAKEKGIKSIRFVSNENLLTELKNLDVL
jgi:FMN phosphatase YigB (HAD superfamily)